MPDCRVKVEVEATPTSHSRSSKSLCGTRRNSGDPFDPAIDEHLVTAAFDLVSVCMTNFAFFTPLSLRRFRLGLIASSFASTATLAFASS
jgi:hypothetical protein